MGGLQLLANPSSVTAVLQNATTVLVSWGPVAGAVTYTVRRNTSVLAQQITGLSLTDSGLPPSTLENYTVSAVNAAGEGPQSLIASVTTPGGPVPAQVVGLSAVAVSATQINLSWTAQANTTYTVYQSGATLVNNLVNPNFNVTGLQAGFIYSFTVAASNINGIGPQSLPTNTVTLPGQVQNLVVTSVTTNSATLTWNSVAASTLYKIYRNGTSSNSVGAGTLTFTDTGLNPSTTYTYAVSAVNASGEGVKSTITSATTSGSGGITVLSFLDSLRGTGTMLSGCHWDQFTSPAGGTYGNGLDLFLPSGPQVQTPTNITVNDNVNGDTHLCPAMIAVWLNDGAGSTPTQAQCIATAQGLLDANTIVQINYAPASPVNGSFTGPGGEFPNIITNNGNSTFNNFMYGSGGPGAPNGGIWLQAQHLLALAPHGTVIFRMFFENNLGTGNGGWWFGTGGGGPTSAQFVTMWKQVVDYMTTLGVDFVNKVLLHWCVNTFGAGSVSGNDPGPSYRAIVGGDLYGPTTQAQVTGYLTNGSACFPYLQSLGVPMLFGEFGVASSSNQTVTQNTYDTSIFDQAVQSAASNLVGGMCWCQNYALPLQNHAQRYLQNTITRSQLPNLL